MSTRLSSGRSASRRSIPLGRSVRRVVELLESRRLLCAGTNPEGYVPTRLTPGHDHYAEGGIVTLSNSPAGRSAGGDATPNLSLTDVYMTDADGNEIATPAIGTYAYMQAEFTTVDIPANTTYTVRMTVGGQNIDYAINWGSGQAGTGGYVLRLGVWLITAGFKNASVTLDVNNDVAESSGLDNTGSTNFTPASPGTKFVMPIEGTAWLDWTAVNYVDLALDGTVGDYRGGSWAYDGHNGWDLTTANWREPDAGLSVYAAAPGTVTAAVDGNFDRINTWTNPPQANYVTIDHGNGFSTTYYHLRKYSVNVSVGQNVVAGQQIGLVGSSGRSTNPHLHFGVYYHGMLAEPNVSATSYFSAGNTLGYAGDNPTWMDAGVIDVAPTTQEWYEGPPTINTFNPGDTVRTWAMGGGLQLNDSVQVKWYNPSGTNVATSTWAFGSAEGQYSGWNASYTLPANAPLGTWQVAYLINGTEFVRRDIGVRSTALPAEVQMTDTAGNYIKDGRTTPFDLGEIWEDTPNTLPTFSFRVRNRGSSTLTTDSLAVPAGFTVTDGLAASIAAGSFDTVTLRLDDVVPGWKIGYVTFNTSDGDPGEGQMSFRVEGRVNGVTPMNLAEDPDTVYIKRGGANTQVWINRSTALSPSAEFPVGETAGWILNTGLGNDTVTVDFTDGNPLQDTLDLDLGTGADTLRIIGTTGDDTAIVGNGIVAFASRSINFTSASGLSFDGGAGNDAVHLNLPLFGSLGDLDDITVPLTVTGGSGTDSLYAHDGDDTLVRTYNIDENNMTRGGSFGGVTWTNSLELFRLNGNGMAGTYNVDSTSGTLVTNVEINAGAGNDSLNYGDSDLSSMSAAVTFDGQDGTDGVVVDDSTSNNAGAWTIDANSVDRVGSGGLDYTNAESLIVMTSQAAQTVTVTSTNQFASLDLRTNGGVDTINIEGNYFGAEVTVNGGTGADVLTINGDAAGSARVRLIAAEDLGLLTIAAGGSLVINGSVVEANVLRMTGLSITGNGYVDVANNPMILDYAGATPIDTVRSLIASGYANGAWNGAGIRASTAASAAGRSYGYAEASAVTSVFPAPFAGQTVDNTSILFRNTQVGDTDLDRDVDFEDLLRQAQNYGLAGTRYWHQGDFTFDGTVGFDDLLGLAQQYGTAFSVEPIQTPKKTVRDAILS